MKIDLATLLGGALCGFVIWLLIWSVAVACVAVGGSPVTCGL